MKRWLKVVVIAIAVLAIMLVAFNLAAGHMVTAAINAAGPKVLGVPVSVKNVNVGLLRDQFELNTLVIGNPEGFKTPEAIRLKQVSVSVKMTSLFTKVLVIDSIMVDGPEITYEVGLKGSNLGAIQDKLAPSKPAGNQPQPAEKPAKAAKKVQINDLLIENGKIHLSTIGMAGNDLLIVLPTIHLRDIGKDTAGASPREVIAKVFDAITGTIGDAVMGAGNGVEAIGKNALGAGQSIGKSADGAGKAASQEATKALEKFGGLFKK
jgi:hypothetical protein